MHVYASAGTRKALAATSNTNDNANSNDSVVRIQRSEICVAGQGLWDSEVAGKCIYSTLKYIWISHGLDSSQVDWEVLS